MGYSEEILPGREGGTGNRGELRDRVRDRQRLCGGRSGIAFNDINQELVDKGCLLQGCRHRGERSYVCDVTGENAVAGTTERITKDPGDQINDIQ